MTDTSGTPLSALNGEDRLTFHQTTPLRQNGITTVERLAELVDAHRTNPADSELAKVPGFARTRIERACRAIDQWRDRAAQPATTE